MVARHPFAMALTVLLALAMVGTETTPAGGQEHESYTQSLPAAELTLDALLAATPPGVPDIDGDKLPDPVEAVFGTMADESDSDLDGLSDYDEIVAGLDPLEIDTNNDGLPDGLEMEGPDDFDGDLILNVWDNDNDNDGVSDGIDLNPNATTEAFESFTIDLTTMGGATYVDFQVRPFDETHLSLFGAEFGWPVEDKGTIINRGDDGNPPDVSIRPMLQLTAATGPDASLVGAYGIVTLPPNEAAGEAPGSWKALVPLLPVTDRGNTVAFAGRMFYPEGTQDPSATVKLVWVTEGSGVTTSDSRIVDVVDEDRKNELAGLVGWPVPSGGHLYSGETPEGNAAFCVVEDIVTTTVADGYEIEFICDEPPEHSGEWGHQYQYLVGGVNIGISDVDRIGVDESPTIIARYQEPFILTGLEATENHEVELGVVHGGTPDEFVSAGLVLDYEYLRTQRTLADVIGDLASLNLSNVAAVTETTTHVDAALTRSSEIIDGAFTGVAPVFTIIGDRSTTRIPAEWTDSDRVHEETNLTLALDNTAYTVTTKTMVLDWFDQEAGQVREDFMAEFDNWGLDVSAQEHVGRLVLVWSAGETHITNVGGTPVVYDMPEWTGVFNHIEAGLVLTNDLAWLGMTLDASLGNWKFLKGLGKTGWSVSIRGMNLNSIGKLKFGLRNSWSALASGKIPLGGVSRFGRIMRGLSKAGKVCEYLTLVVGAVQGFLIWYQSGWTLEGFARGLWAFNLYLLTFTVFYVLGTIAEVCLATAGAGCVVAGVVALVAVIAGGLIFLLDYIFKWGWWDAFEDWWNGLWGSGGGEETWALVDLTFEYTVSPSTRIIDYDDNGLDVGDTIRMEGETRRSHQATKSHTTAADMWFSGIFPTLVGDACLLEDDTTYSCLPAGSCTGGPGSGNVSCSGDIADIESQRDDYQTLFDPPAIWDYVASGYNEAYNLRCDEMSTGTDCWIHADSLQTLDADPKQATTDFELMIGTAYEGQFYVYHDRDGGSDYRSVEPISDDGTENMEPMHFDVMPASIAEFLAWSVITAVDTDGDGLADTEDGFPNAYDQDGDGLSDYFEDRFGTEIDNPDTDGDGTWDGEELVNRTDPDGEDTDGDSVIDGAEAAERRIEFVYYGTTFETMVTSDPLLADADNDGLTDADEEAWGTNPNAWDTDGDGFRDGPNTDPTAAGDNYATTSGTALVVSAPGLLVNDVDNELDPIRVENVDTFGLNGELSWNPDGSFTYDPADAFDLPPHETAEDAFVYTLGDGRGGEDYAIVTIIVSPEIPPGSVFTDDDGSIFEASIEWLARNGITLGCNPPVNDEYCPHDDVTRGQMAAFLVRALGLTDRGTIDFVDDDHSIFEPSIEKLAAAGITRGCNPPVNDRYCPEGPVTRGQMAAFLVRALKLTEQGTIDFVDDDGSVFEDDIEKLANAGITLGCNPPANDRFCPDGLVTRGQMAAFLHRALG